MPAAVTSIAAGDQLDVKSSNAKNKRPITVANVLKALPLAPLGVTAGASTAAAGSAAGDAAALPAGTGIYYPTTAANGTTGVIVNAADNVTGRVVIVGNGAAAVLKIYPTTGGAINNAAANAAFSTASGKGAIMLCTDGTAKTWLAWS